MIIELENIHAKWKVHIGNTCMLLANGNETVWIRAGFGVYGKESLLGINLIACTQRSFYVDGL
jgi:hypothetical protein